MATNTTVTTDEKLTPEQEAEKIVQAALQEAEKIKREAAEAAEKTKAEAAQTDKPGNVDSDADMERAENATREALAKDTMWVIISGTPDSGANWEGIVNGVPYAFPYNKLIEIPRALYGLICSTNTVRDQTAALERSAANMAVRAKRK